ncbi:MAG TPA: MerR family transcriptional regulator [Streptosporangiaceae bacterium]|nr:MerR family transcriptional regulator [Streptosporangiaceae bacterium]
MQIGEVAERTGLSLRTIRYYGEVGLVTPSARSRGGFRLYTEADVDRLLLVKRMKPLEFSLEEMADLLGILDGLAGAGPRDRPALQDRLTTYEQAAQARCAALRDQLGVAEDFAARLHQARQAARGKEGSRR